MEPPDVSVNFLGGSVRYQHQMCTTTTTTTNTTTTTTIVLTCTVSIAIDSYTATRAQLISTTTNADVTRRHRIFKILDSCSTNVSP